MKNQYFGDINDYRKYGLLRILSAGGKNKIAVCWMLTANDGRTDGKFTDYLTQPERWRLFDPYLFGILFNAIVRNGERNVFSVEKHKLIRSATYYSPILTDQNRREYFGTFEAEAHGADLIFFDPDNGMEVRSVPQGGRGFHKYLSWEETSIFFSQGHSLLIYQHFPRIEREKFVRLMVRRFFTRTTAPRVYSFRTEKVVFFLLVQKLHLNLFNDVVRNVERIWGKEIKAQEHHPWK